MKIEFIEWHDELPEYDGGDQYEVPWTNHAFGYDDDLSRLPDARFQPDQVPHFLVIEMIAPDPYDSEMHLECPLDHETERHYCTSLYVGHGTRFKIPGATVHVGFRTTAHCWITEDCLNTGVEEMLGMQHWPRLDHWPDWMPQQPGVYPVIWQCEGQGEGFTSWLALVGEDGKPLG